MVVILVHWLIKRGREREFESRWREMSVDRHSGLYREILTTIDAGTQNAKFHTFSIGDPFYATYVNVGMWESIEKFDAAVGKYIPEAETVVKDGRTKYTIELESFEFKLRERVVLKVVADRGGALPNAELGE